MDKETIETIGAYTVIFALVVGTIFAALMGKEDVAGIFIIFALAVWILS